MNKSQHRYVSILNGTGLNRPYSLSIISEESSDSSSPSSPEFDLEFLEPITPHLDLDDAPIRKNRHCIRFDRPPSMPIILDHVDAPTKNSLKKGIKANLIKNIKNKSNTITTPIVEDENKTKKVDMGQLNVIRPHTVDETTKRNIFGFHIRKSSSALNSNAFDSMLFDNEDSTLHLSLTPNWLHSRS